MDSKLPATGTAQYLTLVSTFVPDTFINELMPRPKGRGRRQQFSPAQLYRVHLLSVSTPVHAFNQLVRLTFHACPWRVTSIAFFFDMGDCMMFTSKSVLCQYCKPFFEVICTLETIDCNGFMAGSHNRSTTCSEAFFI